MDWLAGIVELIAKYLCGKKSRYGWLIHIIAGLLWMFVAVQTGVYGLLVIVIPSLGLNMYNYWKWSNEYHCNKLREGK